jgi:hypothetical protein
MTLLAVGLAALPVQAVEPLVSSTWTLDATPNPLGLYQGHALKDVASFSSTDAWAVMQQGDNPTGLLHWDGSGWAQIESPSPGAHRQLNGVGGSSGTDVWAVGWYRSTDYDRTLILHWNGVSWSKVASPSPQPHTTYDLFGVAATSPSNAWAVGTSWDGNVRKSLILRWNGQKWSKVASPNPGAGYQGTELARVDATSAGNAWAVGTYTPVGKSNQSLILRWNGQKWSKVPSPNPGGPKRSNYLSAISAVSATDAWAVGTYATNTQTIRTKPLLLHWNGTTWKTFTNASTGISTKDVWIMGVAATSKTNAWAVGWFWNGNARRSLVLHWDGTEWRTKPSPNTSSTQWNELWAVAATSSSSAVAVGTYVADNHANRTLAMHCC